jgi:hypothetical protein
VGTPKPWELWEREPEQRVGDPKPGELRGWDPPNQERLGVCVRRSGLGVEVGIADLVAGRVGGSETVGNLLARLGKTIYILDLLVCPPAAAAGSQPRVQGCREGSRTTGCIGDRSCRRRGGGKSNGRAARAPNAKQMWGGAPEGLGRGYQRGWGGGGRGRGPQRGLVLRRVMGPGAPRGVSFSATCASQARDPRGIG